MRAIVTMFQKRYRWFAVLFFVLFELTSSAQTRSFSDLFYYFGSQKVMLKESTTKLYLRVPATAVEMVKGSIQTHFGLSAEAFSNTGESNFLVLDLAASSVRLSEAREYIKANIPQVEMSRPVIVAADGADQVIDEWFYVKLKPEFSLEDLQLLLDKHNCSINTKYQYDERIYILKANIANNFDGLKMANQLFEEGLFEYAEPDFRVLEMLHTPPNDPLYNLQWSHLNSGSASQYSGMVNADMNVDDAWAITQGSPSVRVAVLDEGVQRNHPDLINNIDPLGYGVVSSVASTGDLLGTGRAHGTNVAGIIAAQANNGIGVAGIAPNCKIIPINITINSTGTFGSYTQIATAIDWAWNTANADVLNNSWGGGTASSLLQNAIHNAVTFGRGGKGAVVLFSSGNNNAGLFSPAYFNDVIAVGATSMCNQRKSVTSCDGENWWGGNYGTGLDISAPGVKIATTDNTGSGGYNTSSGTNGDYYNTFNGTSSACPNASGVVALMLSINDTLSALRVKEILERTATKVGTYNYLRNTAQQNGTWSNDMGHGLVNAHAAVVAAQNDIKFCPVSIALSGSSQVCEGSSVLLQVVNPVSAANYAWLKDGIIITTATGTDYQADNSGKYSVVITNGTCTDTSAELSVNVSTSTGILLAHAGNDTSVFAGAKLVLGGGPAGSGGTPIAEPMKILAVDIYNNQLLRFDPENPSENYRVIKNNFFPGISSSSFFSGAAATPHGLYMAVRSGRYLVKVDTATGSFVNVGSFGVSFDFGAMTYDPVTGNIYALRESNNSLYTINRYTGLAAFVTSVDYTSTTFTSLAADTFGNLFGIANAATNSTGSVLYTINKSTGVTTYIGPLGYNGGYAQDGTIDLNTNELYVAPYAAVLNNTSYTSGGLWTVNKSSGLATLIGSIAAPFNQFDAMAIPKPAYRYLWSPNTGLSNPNDGNPYFTPPGPGKYTFVLTVTDLCGNTALDSVIITVCPSSVNPSGMSTTNIVDTAATVNWSSIADNTTIEYGLSGFVQGTGTMVTGINANNYIITGLTGNTTYQYYVRASCLTNISSWVGPFSFTTIDPVSIDAIALDGNIKSQKSQLNWTVEKEQDVNYYAVEQSESGNEFVAVHQEKAKWNKQSKAVYTWQDNSVLQSSRFYRIVGYSMDGAKYYSNVLKLKSNASNAVGFEVYPNPTKGDFKIRFYNGLIGDYKMELFNASGALVITQWIKPVRNKFEYAIHLNSQLPAGLYWIKLSNKANDISMQQKIVVE